MSQRSNFGWLAQVPREAALRAYVAEKSAKNVRMLGGKQREDMPAFLSAANLAVVPLRDVPLFHGAAPSKIFDAWACACPTLITIQGEAKQIVEEANAGIFVPSEQPQLLADAIRECQKNPAKLIKMGENGRTHVQQHYSRQSQAKQLARLLEAL